LTVNADWIVNSGPELDYVARETTRVRVYPLRDGARRITFDTLITSRIDALGLGGSDDAKGYGGFSIRLVRPDRLTFASGGKIVTPTDTALEAGSSMGFAWPAEAGSPAWTVGLSCTANGQPIKSWILRKSLSMQNCVFPGRAPFVLKKDETLRLRETLVIRPATPPQAEEALTMVEILNLNKARKAKAKTEDKTRAAENRAKHGRSKIEKTLDAARADKLRRDLDGAKRED
jgi:hypothetical protein